MKITRLLFICSVLLTIACEDNANDLEMVKDTNITNNLKNRTQTVINTRESIDQFQKKLQWVSYISAQVIMNKSSNRVELFNYLNGRETVTLNELIGENSNLNFKNEFLNVLRSFINETPPGRDPIHGTQSPPEPLVTCEDDLGDCLSPIHNIIQIAEQFFLRSVLQQNCIELYFPEGLHPLVNPNLPYSVTSTAHPLNYDSFNHGYHHSSVTSDQSDRNGVTKVNTVNTLYLNTMTDNVIVARPYVNQTNCTYPEYLLINLAAFLQQ